MRRFPRRTLRADRVLHRIHKAANAPWRFSSDGSGRFDPLGVPGLGCCYLAESPLGTWVEVFRRQTVIAEAEVQARKLLSVPLGWETQLADLTSRRALQFGVTATTAAGDDYDANQQLAADAAQAGFGGIRYFVRHDPRQKLYGVALFGPAGTPAAGDRRWPAVPERELPDQLLGEAARVFGYKVVPIP